MKIYGLVHSAHAAGCGSGRLGSGNIRHDALGREQGSRYGSRVLQYASRDLGRIDDAAFDHIGVSIVQCIVTVVGLFGGKDLIDDDGTVESGVFRNLSDRFFQWL